MFDATYEVNEKFRIGVSVEYRDQSTPCFNPNGGSQFGGSQFGASPFRTSPFGAGF